MARNIFCSLVLLLAVSLFISCNEDKPSKSQLDFMYGKWKVMRDTNETELWINQERIFFGVPDRTISSGGQDIEIGGIGVVTEYGIEDNLIVGKIKGITVHSAGDVPLPTKYGNDTIGFVLNHKFIKLYRVEKGIPSIEDNMTWKLKAFAEMGKRVSK